MMQQSMLIVINDVLIDTRVHLSAGTQESATLLAPESTRGGWLHIAGAHMVFHYSLLGPCAACRSPTICCLYRD